MRYSEERVQEIFEAVFSLLSHKDIRRVTMAEISRVCHVSKETLYRWFGNKAGLLAAMVRDQADQISRAMRDIEKFESSDPQGLIFQFAYWYLQTVLDDRSVRLNQMAIATAHEEPALAKILIANGRERALPLLEQILAQYQSKGVLTKHVMPIRMAESLLGLSAGDLQIRRLLHYVPDKPTEKEIRERAIFAVDMFFKAFYVHDSDSEALHE